MFRPIHSHGILLTLSCDKKAQRKELKTVGRKEFQIAFHVLTIRVLDRNNENLLYRFLVLI